MHMADALVSPAVGGVMGAVSGGLIAWCAKSIRDTRDDRLIPLMGVLGAFVFTAQMINFSIPATGSSGHLGGALLLSVLLGPCAAFLVMASVLTVQALFFADGGLLALGCNIFNLGFAPAFIAYPLLYKPIAGTGRQGARLWVAALVAALVGLQLGAFGVVLETTVSGLSALSFKTFLLFMQPIHLAIGVVEGLVTAGVVALVARSRPEVLAAERNRGLPPVWVGLLLAAALLGGMVSWYASTRPDGLEWAIAKASPREVQPASADGVHARIAAVQAKTVLLPDYGFRTSAGGPSRERLGTSLSGLVGGALTLIVVVLLGLWMGRCRTRIVNSKP